MNCSSHILAARYLAFLPFMNFSSMYSFATESTGSLKNIMQNDLCFTILYYIVCILVWFGKNIALPTNI